MNMIQAAQESRATTALGGLASLTGIIVALLPADVKESCFTSIQNSNNPAVVGGLIITGLVLTIVGPSFTKKA